MKLMIVCLSLIITAQQLLHHKEREDLYNRLMCRNLDEYKRACSKEPPAERRESPHQRAIRDWRERGEIMKSESMKTERVKNGE